jgi:hypothetical protein
VTTQFSIQYVHQGLFSRPKQPQHSRSRPLKLLLGTGRVILSQKLNYVFVAYDKIIFYHFGPERQVVNFKHYFDVV